MHSIRITRIQKRAKRRILALAICATALTCYGTARLFANDGIVQPPVAELSKVPGVRAVGIRLINPSGKSTSTKAPSAQAQFLPAAQPDASNQVASKALDLPIAPPPHFTALPPPPRMSEITPKSSGKVNVKINVDTLTILPSTPSVELPTVVLPKANAETKANTEEAATSVPALPPSASKAPVRISMSNGIITEGHAISLVEPRPMVAPRNRSPELVKSKPTQIMQTVVLAQSAEIEQEDLAEAPHDGSLGVDLGRQSQSTSVNAKLASPSKSSSSSTATALGNSGSFVSLAPTPFEIYNESIETPKGNVAKVETQERNRRSFDVRSASQTPNATIELESLNASTMDIPGRIRAVAVQDEEICKIFHNERSLSLVGNQIGSTLVQIWTDDLGEKPQVVRVNVSQAWTKIQAGKTEVRDIKQVISQTFPRAEVNILTSEDGSIEVRGTTDTEESACRILELVRKLYLVPVRDRVTVSR